MWKCKSKTWAKIWQDQSVNQIGRFIRTYYDYGHLLKDKCWLLFIKKFQLASFFFRLDLLFVISLSNLTCYCTRKFCSFSSSEITTGLWICQSLQLFYLVFLHDNWHVQISWTNFLPDFICRLQCTLFN